jgi:hypothetical protein
MAQLINLRSVRKNRMRAQSDAEAKIKRERHGRTKAEKKLAEARTDKARQTLDGLRLASGPPPEDPSSD